MNDIIVRFHVGVSSPLIWSQFYNKPEQKLVDVDWWELRNGLLSSHDSTPKKAKVAHILLSQSPRNLIEKDAKWFGRKSGLWYQVYGLDVKATSATVW